MTLQVVDTIDLSRFANIEVDHVDVGFFATAKYPDGTPVAEVAADNEFGRANVPERPFFRQAIEAVGDEALRELADAVSSDSELDISVEAAERVGAVVAGKVQESITDLKEPPNSPATIARKGSSNPLIDTGVMRQAVTYEVA